MNALMPARTDSGSLWRVITQGHPGVLGMLLYLDV